MLIIPIRKYIICETAILIRSKIVGFDFRDGGFRILEFAKISITIMFPTVPMKNAIKTVYQFR